MKGKSTSPPGQESISARKEGKLGVGGPSVREGQFLTSERDLI